MTFRRFGRWPGVLGAVILLSAAVAGQQQPRFTTRVDVAIVDVGVVDNGGHPIPNLTPEDFSVRIDGRPSRVVMADWVSTTADVASLAPKARVPDGYTSNAGESGGRLVAVALDQPSISANGAAVLQRSASAFVDRLSAADRVAAVGLGMHRMSTPFTSDHERVKKAIQTMIGERQDSQMLSGPEAIEIEAQELTRPDALMASSGELPSRSKTGTTDSSSGVSRDVSAQFREMVSSSTVGRVMRRECPGVFSAGASATNDLLACRQRLLEEARPVAEQSRRERDATLGRLRELLVALQAIEGPKAVVLVSGGLILEDQHSLIQELGRAAAAAEATLYVLHVERPPVSAAVSRNVGAAAANPRMERQGLEELATAARGTLLTVNGEGAGAFDRIQSELSGYYLLGVEYDVRNDEGKAHAIRVEVARKGVTIRARQFLLNTAAATTPAPRSPQALAAAALATPLPMSTVGLRVATFSLRGADASQVQLLIHTEIANTASNRPVSLGFTLMDSRGQVVASQLFDTRLGASSPDVESASEYVAGATVPPGDYLLKFAVADGDRVGSVEHPVHASLAAAGRMTLSDLFAGGPAQGADPARPTLGHAIRFGRVHGYVEAYGAGVESLSVKYEIAVDAQSPALLEQSVDAHLDAPGRARFSAILPAGSLPPREYLLRAVVSSGGQVLKTLTRTFEIAPADTITPTAASSPAAGTPAPVVGTDLFLPVDSGALRRFSSEQAVQPAVLRAFRERVATAARPAFDSGVEHLRKGEHTAAEASFKLTIAPGTESTAGLAYLGATYAASGHDAEAAAVWQTALMGGSDLPELFAWAADALIRAHNIGGAQPIVEEAVSRWPDDQRFAVPRAILDATLGRGREAVLTLSRHIADGHDDPDTLALAAQWMYQAHAQGAIVRSQSEDVDDMRRWAAAYARTDGPKSALMKEWLAFLERQAP